MDDFEIVIVDGASTDGTWDVCRQYAESDGRVRIFREVVNSGPVRGWWRCVEEARGRYGTFLWSDDLLMPTFLERMTPFLADDEVAFVYSAAEIGTQPGRGRIAYSLNNSQRIPSKLFIIESLRSRGEFPVSPACALFRVEDLRRNFITELPTSPATDLTDTGAGVDMMFFLSAAAERPWVVHLAEALAFFRAHDGSISTQGRAGKVALHYALAKSWFALSYGRADLVPTVLAWHWLDVMRSSRRVVSPIDAAGRYGSLTSPLRLTAAAFAVLARVLRNRLSRNRRTIRGGRSI